MNFKSRFRKASETSDKPANQATAIPAAVGDYTIGWKVEYGFLAKLSKATEGRDFPADMETCEAVLLALQYLGLIEIKPNIQTSNQATEN